MRGKVVTVGVVVFLFGLWFGFEAVYFSRAMGDAAYRIPYLFRDPPARVHYTDMYTHTAGPDVKRDAVFQGSRQSIYANGEVRWGIVYRSWYDTSRRQYLYEIRNTGKKPTCARSPLFLKLIGRRNIHLAKRGIAHIVLPRDAPSPPQKVNEAVFDFNFFDGGCVFPSLKAAGDKATMRVIVPESMQ
ncbi:MAG: hypothetical protein A2945_04730 [Candidatus Liptonbacteria bacterium RIFCSPLOWO2_01_FULL_52_25]|uniref:Uncharacterized protein n=1 Tax=Candidatus Liptonbacteria bacterium RIFCSPLOWO2_01_FULL_52_25 TaxID=1798650 RepID=A0A1G2CCY2_9BACT|nr:MAG: hypothetical protein A2945_04730 [Candidatus Liptonbacteria bacterium RIFCSPLOWO2_01_FULL_52_25]